ncbi:tRNA-uridine aminocarboxypropyltransferase [Vibrio panuliri]|uniref:tRNA-uridine aminocarboxypropyltransferase n=1 Tax=Vibrio panuliri TaxID=1381081 RepID=A0ABX3FCX3_9VIBR|nr:DTW domain-containing protein [Vibrio panuliri]KAB1460995.1 DTW domain-containing protein [Vibrio panuliri]OLQ89809.1 DTW domain-containing protein [Vibrio panuliri]
MSNITGCHGCGLHHQCVCHLVPHIEVPVHIALLMHENEVTRETNTGQWLLKALPSTSKHIWQRRSPCPELIKLIESDHYQPYLLYPSDNSVSLSEVTNMSAQQQKVPLLIILDGTWQEAAKMLRKSGWLAALPGVHLTPSQPSAYQLRRNQQQGHLCTFEVGAEVIKELGFTHQAQQLEDFFQQYIPIFKADKSGHALKHQ